VDTIGIEIGDTNYVFGDIRSVDFDSRGDLLVLDPATSSFSVFSPSGEFVARIGRAGSGPGEFLSPSGLCVLTSGDVAVSDPRGRLVSIFGPDYRFLYNVDGYYPTAPFVMQPSPDGGIVGYQRIIRPRDNEIGYALARWGDGPDPLVEYLSSTEPFDPEEVASSFLEEDIRFAVGSDGTVYATVSSTDSWEVLCFSVDGDAVASIERPYTPVHKTDEELEADVEEFDSMISQRSGGRGGGPGGGFEFEPDPLKVSITGIFVDGEDRIWVRSGTRPDPWFDVYDPDGTELFTASFDTGTEEHVDMQVYINHYGMAAWEGDPLNFPRIYLLELNAPEPVDPEARGTV